MEIQVFSCGEVPSCMGSRPSLGLHQWPGSRTRQVWLPWKYRFLAVVRCQAAWALALPLSYIIRCTGGGPAAWATACLPYHPCPGLRPGDDPPAPLQSDDSETPRRRPSSAAAKWRQWDVTTVGVALRDPLNWESPKWESISFCCCCCCLH